ncbi:glycosyltransferase family 2 protein [uncultured Algibacter sp.]|uniref:glycosyltransferase family 2 protein n=1 Tax=uncultured Algibacter sp. TaxID=298659 RepID=UPI00262F775E|nr:glycosyltransferase family 2 protein [uncultured Algibacter sp.]
MAKFTIVIPTFNSEETFNSCLRSLKNQTFKDFEVLIIDNLSTDDTLNIANQHQKKIADMTIFSEKDYGIYDAMNKGIEIANGKWLFFMGSDDTLYSNTVLENVSKITDNTKAKVVYGDVRILGDAGWAKNGDIYAGEFTIPKLLNQNICHQAIFYNTQFVKEEIGNFNLEYKKSSDWDFNLKCWAKQPFEYVNLIVANFKAGGFSTDSFDAQISNDFLDNVLKYFRINSFHPYVNTPTFIFYDQVIKRQKKDYPFRYKIERLKSKIFKKFSLK